MRISLYILLVTVLMSCSRSVHKATSETNKAAQQTVSVIDTTASTFVKEQSSTVKYGDRLTGSIHIPLETVKAPNSDTSKGELVAIDSLSSEGVKVKLTVTRVKGGLKANIEATAKPLAVTSNTKETLKVNNGISNQSFSSTTEKVKTRSKQTENDGFPWGLFIALVALVVIAILLINKKFNNGKGKQSKS